MDKKGSFANIYGIDSNDYMEVKTESANFSVRTFGRLRASKIYTIGDLLKRDKADLFSIIKRYIDFGALLLEQEYKYNRDIYSHLVNLDEGI